MMNVVNKLLTFGHINLIEQITDDTPEHINYMYGFILWIFIPIVALIPAFLVDEDLRRLNMKDVRNSNYIEEKTLMALENNEKELIIKKHSLVAEDGIID